jgi:hypothetical protein
MDLELRMVSERCVRGVAAFRRAVVIAIVLTIAALAVPHAAGAKPRIGFSYGMLGTRTIYVTATVAGVRGKAAVLLESKAHTGVTRLQSRPLRRGVAKLSWRYPARAKRLVLRVRVTRAGRRGRTLASGPWKSIAAGRTRAASPVAAVAPSKVLAAPVPGVPGQLVLQGRPGVNPGDVVAAGIGPATPEGLLVKATAVTRSGAQTTVSTEPATLPEAIPNGELDLQLPGEPAAQVSASPLRRLAHALDCTNGRSAEAVGEASMSAGLTLSTKWRTPHRFALPKLTARFSGDVRANLRASASISGEAKCTMDREPLFPAPIKLATFATSIGPVPVAGIVYGQIYLSGSAEANGKIETSVSATAGATAGVEYDGQRFKPFGKLDKSFTASPPTVSASGSVAASIAPAVDVRFYGLGGPEIDYSAGLKLAADINPAPGEPWWKLTAPLDLGAQLRLDAWTLHLQSERFSIWSEEPELARASTPAGGSSITDQGISPDPLPDGIRTRLTWDSDTDVDLHTWDQDGNHAYFDDQYAIASGFLDQDVIPGYGPETFQETDPGHTFTFGVCQYNGEQANVTVDVRDPDGQTRRFAVTLRGRKAASLLTISPSAGDGYLPEPGWCNLDSNTDPQAIGDTSTGTFGD